MRNHRTPILALLKLTHCAITGTAPKTLGLTLDYEVAYQPFKWGATIDSWLDLESATCVDGCVGCSKNCDCEVAESCRFDHIRSHRLESPLYVFQDCLYTVPSNCQVRVNGTVAIELTSWDWCNLDSSSFIFRVPYLDPTYFQQTLDVFAFSFPVVTQGTNDAKDLRPISFESATLIDTSGPEQRHLDPIFCRLNNSAASGAFHIATGADYSSLVDAKDLMDLESIKVPGKFVLHIKTSNEGAYLVGPPRIYFTNSSVFWGEGGPIF